ncbi:hypothetical protein [Mesoterricola silvestris]|uniref:Uncharacterized protein n=1 Tax=Mesoterricola silvestris TaxID=2927979 RepID=A0AA48KAD4_9BACT|nr:hypothetical protein [Mesoterricola silvestris]BDU74511.1 hypothetical protein METEAL_36850 [Mesoterricola silvestris]
MTWTWVRAGALALAGLAAAGQETPMNNRVVWFRILPEPMPEGVTAFALEASSQFLRTGNETSADGRSRAVLDGEDWQLTGDLAGRLGPGRFNVRLRAVASSGGMGDQAVASFHKLFALPDGSRGQVPRNQLEYRLVVNGRPVAALDRPATRLLATDLAYVVDFGNRATGWRVGASLQVPTGSDRDWSSSGGFNELAGVAGWRTWGRWTLHGQGEVLHLDLPGASPFREAMPRRTLGRAWAGIGFRDDGPGFWRGFAVDVTLQYHPSPYKVGVDWIDLPGIQQHWTFSHRNLPRWRFGFSEDAGSYTEPDITVFAVFRP